MGTYVCCMQTKDAPRNGRRSSRPASVWAETRRWESLNQFSAPLAASSWICFLSSSRNFPPKLLSCHISYIFLYQNKKPYLCGFFEPNYSITYRNAAGLPPAEGAFTKNKHADNRKRCERKKWTCCLPAPAGSHAKPSDTVNRILLAVPRPLET